MTDYQDLKVGDEVVDSKYPKGIPLNIEGWWKVVEGTHGIILEKTIRIPIKMTTVGRYKKRS